MTRAGRILEMIEIDELEGSYIFVRDDNGKRVVLDTNGKWVGYGAPIHGLHQVHDTRAAMKFASSLGAKAVSSGQYEHATKSNPALGIHHALSNPVGRGAMQASAI